MDKEWVRSLRSQCQSTGVPFFFKQWGGVHKSRAGRLLDGRLYDELPTRSHAPFPSDQHRSGLRRNVDERARQWVAEKKAIKRSDAFVARDVQ